MFILGQQIPDPKPPTISTQPAGLHFVKSVTTPATYQFAASSRSESIFTVELKGKEYGLWETLGSGTRVRIAASSLDNAELGTDSFGDPVVIQSVHQPKQANAPFCGFNRSTGQYVSPAFSIAYVNGVRYLSSAAGTTFNRGYPLREPKPEVVYPADLGLIGISPTGNIALVSQNNLRREPETNKLVGGHMLSLIDLNSETPSMRPILLSGEDPFWPGALSIAQGAIISENDALFFVDPASFIPPKDVEMGFVCGTFDLMRPRWLVLTHVDLETGKVTRLKAIMVTVPMPRIQPFGSERHAVYQATRTRFNVVRLDIMKR